MANSFTPGEWVSVGGWVEHSDDNVGDICVCDPVIMAQSRDRPWSEILANSRLIATAPELLDALITAIPYVETAEVDPAYKPGAVAKVVKQMRAVIAKATGEKE